MAEAILPLRKDDHRKRIKRDLDRPRHGRRSPMFKERKPRRFHLRESEDCIGDARAEVLREWGAR